MRSENKDDLILSSQRELKRRNSSSSTTCMSLEVCGAEKSRPGPIILDKPKLSALLPLSRLKIADIIKNINKANRNLGHVQR